MVWPFTVRINCSSDLKNFANSRPSASNSKKISWSLEQFFLTVGQNNFGNKIPFFDSLSYSDLSVNFFLPFNQYCVGWILGKHAEFSSRNFIDKCSNNLSHALSINFCLLKQVAFLQKDSLYSTYVYVMNLLSIAHHKLPIGL